MRTVSDKMGIRPGIQAYFANAPEAALAAMRLPPLDVAERLAGRFEHIHLFATEAAALEREFPRLKPHLAPGGRLWVSWPKGARRGSGLGLREVIRIGYSHGMVESTCLSVDSTWSALKFTHPRPGKTYANSYGRLPVEGGPPVR